MLITNAAERTCDLDLALHHVTLARFRRVVFDAAARIRFQFAAGPAELEVRGEERDFLVRLRGHGHLRALVEVAVNVLRFDGGRRHFSEHRDESLRLAAILVERDLCLAALVGNPSCQSKYASASASNVPGSTASPLSASARSIACLRISAIASFWRVGADRRNAQRPFGSLYPKLILCLP
ncbi:hypothetical protein HR51_16080 [Burkholderia cepacia]|nr:hypothetical protein HR51_16080 [Burkholderia cepacia]